MKKITFYLCAAILCGLMPACVKDGLSSNADADVPGGPVELRFGVLIPEAASVATRGALLDAAAGETDAGYLGRLKPYLFIFEDTGSPESNYLRTLVHGSQITMNESSSPDGPADADGRVHGPWLQKFTAMVDGTAENAILHLVLIQEDEQEAFEEQLSVMIDRSELGIFSGATGLYSRGAAYWKRIALDMPINSGNKEEIVGLLSHLQLVRNFAQVTLDPEASNRAQLSGNVTSFAVTGFVVVNAMDSGYVAAYNEQTTGENFVSFADGTGKPVTYEQLVKQQAYIPARHPLAGRDNKDNDDLGWVTTADWDLNRPKFSFERPVQNTHRTFVVLRAAVNGSTRYYKIDLGDYDTNESDPITAQYGVFELFHLIRNISYKITITAVASTGHPSVAAAIAAPPANNISASIETANVSSLSDGAETISIEIYDPDGTEIKGNTVVVVDDPDGNPYPAFVNLQWQYFVGSDNKTDEVRYDYPSYALTELQSEMLSAAPSGWTKDGSTNWRGYSLQFNPPGDIPKQQTVKFYKPNGLSRDVTFILRNRWQFVNEDVEDYVSNVEVYPGLYSYEDDTMPPYEKLSEVRSYFDATEGLNGPGEVGSTRGAQLTVMFELPSDIPQQLFPLDFKIGFDRQNTENAYVGNASVVYGDSMFDDDPAGFVPGVPRMQFIKTVDWEYYNGSSDPGDNGHKIVTARFLTTTDVLSNNETDRGETDANGETSTTRVRVTNPYFTLGSDDFKRQVKSDDGELDPNRTVWSWYFGDPGWITCLTPGGVTDPEPILSEPAAGGEAQVVGYTYNGLCFASNYESANQYGRYIGVPYGHSADNPEIWFDVNATAPSPNEDPEATDRGYSGYTAKLTVTATSKWYQNGSYYRRTGKYRITYADGTYAEGTIHDYDKKEAGNNTRRGIPETYSVDNINVPAGQTIKSVQLWTERLGTDPENANAVALYYAIQLKLTPKPAN